MPELDMRTIERVLRATRKVESLPPQLYAPQRRYPKGGGGGVSTPSGTAFWALLTGYKYFDDDTDNIFAYEWAEAQVDCDATGSEASGGLTSDTDGHPTTVSISESAIGLGTGAANAATLTTPSIGSSLLGGTVVSGELEVALEWDGGEGNAVWWIEVGTGTGGPATKWTDIDEGEELTEETYTTTLPADGSTFYITLSYGSDWSDWSYTRYECTITEGLPSYAITAAEINALAAGTLDLPIGGGDKPTSGTEIVEITDDILVRMWKGKRVGCEGVDVDQYFFDAGGGATNGVTDCFEVMIWDDENPPTFNDETCELEGPTKWFRFQNGLLIEAADSEPAGCE